MCQNKVTRAIGRWYCPQIRIGCVSERRKRTGTLDTKVSSISSSILLYSTDFWPNRAAERLLSLLRCRDFSSSRKYWMALSMVTLVRDPGLWGLAASSRSRTVSPAFSQFASVGCLANYPAIIERSLYPFRAAAAPMIDICVLADLRLEDELRNAGRVMTRVNREHIRSPLSGRLYDLYDSSKCSGSD
jgi:hypothetical protein